MRNSANIFLLIFFIFYISTGLAQENITITVTNSNVGLVKETRQLELQKGLQVINLEDIPSAIQAPSVLIESREKNFVVLEQNYEYDLINVDKILNKSIDQQIMLVHPEQGIQSGKLLSAAGSNLMLLDDEDNLQIIPRNDLQKIILKEYSSKKDAFITRPTLVWKVKAAKSGKHQADLSYLTNGLSWRADYVGRLNDDDSALTLACWVTVDNQSGKAYNNARLKLMAGDLNIIRDRSRGLKRAPMTLGVAAEKQFEEKAFFEYYLYTLQDPTDLKNNQVKQIQLFPETVSKVEKIYRVDSRGGDDVSVLVAMKNTKKHNLGFALPGGKIRLYKTDGDDLEFIGEDKIKHTAKDEELEVKVGKAFDVISERKVIESARPSKRSRRQTIEYSLRNHKDQDIVIQVVERLNQYQQNKLLSSSVPPAEKKADMLKFEVPVKKDADTVLKLEYITSW